MRSRWSRFYERGDDDDDDGAWLIPFYGFVKVCVYGQRASG